jgi:hypothetical protein
MTEAQAKAALDAAALALKGATGNQVAPARAAYELARRRWADFERWQLLREARADLAQPQPAGSCLWPRRRVSLGTPFGERIRSADAVVLLAALRGGAKPQGARDVVAVRFLGALR